MVLLVVETDKIITFFRVEVIFFGGLLFAYRALLVLELVQYLLLDAFELALIGRVALVH